MPGRYDVYVWYYSGGTQSEYTVTGEIMLYPVEAARSKRKRFSIILPVSPPRQWHRVATYRPTAVRGEFQIEFLD